MTHASQDAVALTLRQQIAWYRDRAEKHGRVCAMKAVYHFGYGVDQIAEAREAAHYAGLVIALETEARIVLSHGTVLGDPPR